MVLVPGTCSTPVQVEVVYSLVVLLVGVLVPGLLVPGTVVFVAALITSVSSFIMMAMATVSTTSTITSNCSEPTELPAKIQVPRKGQSKVRQIHQNVASNHVDYRSQNGPCLSLLWSEEEYHGQSLYLGGVEGLDGNIYCIPGNANRVLCIDPRTDRVYPLTTGSSSCGDNVSPPQVVPPMVAPATQQQQRQQVELPQLMVTQQSQQQQQQQQQDLLGKFKWLRGIRVEHIIYGLPCHSPTVLRIDTRTQQVTLLPIPYETFYSHHYNSHDDDDDDNNHNNNTKFNNVAHEQRTMEWKYHGGSYSHDEGCIYAIPQSAWHVLRIDTRTDTCTLVPSEPLLGRYKWYGGVVGKDGAIYGIPHNARSVLRIQNNAITLHGDYPDLHKWHGAALAGDGTIVCVPANADFVLCISPASTTTPTLYEIHAPPVIQTGRHRNDGKYKYLGCTRGSDGNIYCFPSGSEYVLQVNTMSRTVHNVGPNLVPMERMVQNKWQNGIRSGDSIYAIPLSAESVLRIDLAATATIPLEQEQAAVVTTWRLPQPHSGLAKWEGAVMASLTTGAIYCMPNNHKAVLRIADTPSCTSMIAADAPILAVEEETVPSQTDQDVRATAAAADSVRPALKTMTEAIDECYKYTTGIPTLRSSAHRVKFSPKHRDASSGKGTCLPLNICENLVLDYDLNRFDFTSVLVAFLKECDPAVVGTLSSDRLEDLQIPTMSLSRGAYGGSCEQAQGYLSDRLAAFEPFMLLFDEFVVDYILPHLKQRLVDNNHHGTNGGALTFYYQRPPTLRLQPGPARAYVKPHCDSEYGHQEGELNFWFPLTDRSITRVDLHVERPTNDATTTTTTTATTSIKDCRDACEAVPVQVGQVLSFHGTSRKHYVNSNPTHFTRVSMDFRVGVEGYFDAAWEMVGTTADHARLRVQV